MNTSVLTEAKDCDYHALDSFVIYVCLSGEMIIEYGSERMTAKMGDALLIPASLKNLKLIPVSANVTVLESYMPESK